MSRRPTVGYIPFRPTSDSVEAGWLAERLSVDVRVAGRAPSLNDPLTRVPDLVELASAVGDLLRLPAVVAEGPAGFLWAALLRANGFTGAAAVIPYLNPCRWQDVAAIGLYRRFARTSDRAFLGSAPSAAVYRSLGIAVSVGEPYGIDTELFRIRPAAARTRLRLGIPSGRMLLFAGRMQPDKDVYRVLRAGLRAQLLFSDLQVVIATHVEDPAYAAAARRMLGDHDSVHFVPDPGREQLADLYSAADVFVTASTSGFETFGRAPAEALACGAPAIAPRYDGFPTVLDQPGGTVIQVHIDQASGTPHIDEELLLRAIYESLSDPRPAAREEISAIARRRFSRSRTLQQLAYLAGEAPGPMSVPPALRIGATSIGQTTHWLPRSWSDALERVSQGEPTDALKWLFERCDHDRLAAHDQEFAASVRRSLCDSAAADGGRVRACR